MPETGHSCGCHHETTTTPKDVPDGRALPVVPRDGLPELDATAIPHAIRHGAILGALGSLAPGNGLILAAPHDPLPLLTQIEDRWGGAIAVDYVERGPEVWRLRMVRTAG